MATQELVANDAQDARSILRLFVNLGSTALGDTPDQNYSSEDASIGQGVGMHAAADPYRGAAVQGTTVPFGISQSGDFTVRPGFLVLALLAVWLLKG